jgi:nitrous oxidase accessory protein
MTIPALLATVSVLIVSPAGPYRTIADALAHAAPGDRIVVRAGTYREPLLRITKRIELIGEGGPVLVGGAHGALEILADSVVVRGLVIEGVEPSLIEDRAGIRIRGVAACLIEDNVLRDTFFGVYAEQARDCRILRNRILGPGRKDAGSGNGIHIWRSLRMTIEGNEVRGHRDGMYLEFSPHAALRGNASIGNARYGLHFMRSDSCAYERNRFERNGAGVAVMYSRGIHMVENRFERNWGNAAYGLLLKDISDGEIRGNHFTRNTVGLYLEDSNRNQVEGNTFTENGWAVKVMANATDNRFTANQFQGNSFDVATNSQSTTSLFEGNWWDRYRGYDLDRDGRGDVPFRPVRLFSVIMEQHEPVVILLRSAFVDLLDAAERLLPVLTPEAMVDARPLMKRPR